MKHHKRSNHNRRLALIIIIYLILATAYSVVVPIGRGADEWAHYWYAQFIAQNGRLPANPIERETAGYKSDWPPLYHLLAAGVTAWVEIDGPPTFKYRADNIRRQLVPALGPEAILHTEDELFPWQQEILVWHLGRFLSIGFAVGTLLVTYYIALEVFTSSQVAEGRGSRGAGDRRSKLALVSVAVLAFNPRFLFTGMLFNYDSLTLLLASLFLWLVIRVAKGYHLQWGYWGLGALAGLALVTKYLAALLPLMIVALVLGRRTEEQGSEGDRSSHLTPQISHSIRRLIIPLAQAALAFLLVTSWWFSYLLINFNQIDTYGPVLGTLAPLIRGDGSDRTVEELFAWLSDGQAPPPPYIEKQSYTVPQIIVEFPATFWGNPIVRPYPLNWFVLSMTLVAVVATGGLVIWWRASPPASLPGRLFSLLLLQCALPLPFMVVRLFGARDALEAVQGRHILFLAGPAVAILLVWGISVISHRSLRDSHFVFYAFLGLLLTGVLSQLIFMGQTYPALLPVRTQPSFEAQVDTLPDEIELEGGANLVGYTISDRNGPALQVTIIWQGGDHPAPEDYKMELALVDSQGRTQSSWLAYQTQARYPTRVWEPGDVIRDQGWLPLVGLTPGDYEVRLRILAETNVVVGWQTLLPYTLSKNRGDGTFGIDEIIYQDEWFLWQQGKIVHAPPTLRERETAQLTIANPLSGLDVSPLQLVGPGGISRMPASADLRWANFVIGPDWPAGNYRIAGGDSHSPLFWVVENDRDFEIPDITYPLEANFADRIKLLGYDLPTRRVQPGEGLPITLYWRGLQWMDTDFVIFDRLLDNQQIVWGGYDRRPQENFSTVLWAPGEIVTDGFAIPVAPDAPDGVYILHLGWYQQLNGEAKSLLILDAETGEPTETTSVTIGPIKVGGPPPGITLTEVTPQYESNIVLGEQIKLLGFDIAGQSDQLAEGESLSILPVPLFLTDSSLDLTFYWQSLLPAETNYTVLAHIRNGAGEIVAQKDSPPAGGAYPTSLWDVGEIIKDEMQVSLEKLEPGQYTLVVGMYDFMTGLRLPIDGSPDGTVLLHSFEVAE